MAATLPGAGRPRRSPAPDTRVAEAETREKTEAFLQERAVRRAIAEARRAEACRRTLEECQIMQQKRMTKKGWK